MKIMDSLNPGRLLNSFTLADLIVIGAMVFLVIAFYVFRRFVRLRLQKLTDNFFILLFKNLNAPIQVLVLLTVLYIMADHLPFKLEDNVWLDKSYAIVIIVLLTWLVLRAVHLSSDLYLKRHKMEEGDNLAARQIHTQVRVVRRVISAVILLIAIATALMTFEQIRALGVSLLASAGVVGIVLGLAAQKTIGNFFTGLQIAITLPIRLGDAVIVENEWGWIEEINLTYVVVKIWDWRRLVLPISYFVDNPFQNWTRTSASILGSVILYLDYTTPVDEIRAELDRILQETDLWDKNAKVVQVMDTTEKTMIIRILVSAVDSPTAWDLRCLVREKMIAFLQANYPESLPRLRAELTDPPVKTAGGKE
ncbi:MAG: mechanosensitive ion channel family protein [Desulfurivibrionaceae bacterium]